MYIIIHTHTLHKHSHTNTHISLIFFPCMILDCSLFVVFYYATLVCDICTLLIEDTDFQDTDCCLVWESGII